MNQFSVDKFLECVCIVDLYLFRFSKMLLVLLLRIVSVISMHSHNISCELGTISTIVVFLRRASVKRCLYERS